VKKICKSELTTKNKITAINQFALPIVTYGFGVVDWPQKHLNTLDIKTRKMLTLHKVIYRNQCLDRIYLPRSEGGMGLQGVSDSFRATIVSLGQYLLSNKDSLMQMVTKQHKDDLPQNVSIIKMGRNYAEDKKNKEAKIIEVSVPNDFGLNRAERHKVNNYQDLKNDLRQTL